MRYPHAALVALVALFGSGCTGGQSGGEVGADKPNATGGASSGSMGSDSDQCVVQSTTPVGWSEATDLGTPEEVFAPVAGTCEAPFAWDGSAADTLTLDPIAGQSTLTVTVDIDEASARLVETEKAPDAGGIVFCGATLEVDATVKLLLVQGELVEEQQVTLSVMKSSGLPSEGPYVSFSVPGEDVGDWVSIAPRNDDTTVTLTFTVAPLGEACAGEVILMSETRLDGGSTAGGVGVGAAGSFASWSDTGCGVGQFPVSLEDPEQGMDLLAAIDQAFGDVELSGVWEDGGTTTLALKTSVAATDVCGEDRNITIPVDVLGSTADGRVESLSGAGTVRATVGENGPTQLDLWLSTELVCQSQTDTLAYRSVDCASGANVTAQLGFNEYLDGTGPTGGRLELYIENRDSSAPSGAADGVDRLDLSR